MTAWRVHPVDDTHQLEQILELQTQNLRAQLSAEVAASQGFVTAVHTLAALRGMHELAPSIVATLEGRVIGYALTMVVEARQYVPLLDPMFRMFEGLAWRGRALSSVPFYVMGQVCIAREHRGQGVFEALYAGHKALYEKTFELLVTEISLRNTRSLRAHEKVGFQPIHRYRDDVDDWSIVAWDWAAGAVRPARP